MPEFHAEPYVYLAGLSHKSALIAWGAFYFKARSDGQAKLVDDQDLQWVHPPRCESIGCRSAPYGPARVEVRDESGAIAAEALTNTCKHNFQHSRWKGIDYFVSGSKIRRQAPNGFERAHTETWSSEYHFLLATIDGATMTVRAIGESPEGTLVDIPRLTPAGEIVRGPIVVRSS